MSTSSSYWEGHDSHNNRRRGFQYFLENTIKPNNEKIGTAHYVASRDLILSEDEGLSCSFLFQMKK